MPSYTVLGAGSWGTTLAQVLALKGSSVRLWAREPEVVESISRVRENSLFLPGIRLSEKISPFNGLSDALDGAELIVSVVPSHGLRDVLSEAREHIRQGAIIVSATKGIEEKGLLTPSGIIKESLSGKDASIVALSGPSFAAEVSKMLPTALSAASDSSSAAIRVQEAFSTGYFRVYTNSDIIGVELGGALKNIMAIASGISDGLGLGHNARAALITRGLAEMSRLGVKMGAQAATFAGLSGLGDLVLTCTGPLSRNYTVGKSLGSGKSLSEATGGMKAVAEGVKTCKGARALARSQGIDMPITEAVYEVLYDGKQPKEAVLDLMNRDLKGE